MARHSMPGFPWGPEGHVTATESHGFLFYIDIGGRLSATSPGGVAKMTSLPYAGPSLGTWGWGNATQKILELIPIEHLGSTRSGETREEGRK